MLVHVNYLLNGAVRTVWTPTVCVPVFVRLMRIHRSEPPEVIVDVFWGTEEGEVG